MGLSLRTAMIIESRGDDVRASYLKDAETGKFAGLIELWKKERLDYTLASTIPMYGSKEEALAAMTETIENVRKAMGSKLGDPE